MFEHDRRGGFIGASLRIGAALGKGIDPKLHRDLQCACQRCLSCLIFAPGKALEAASLTFRAIAAAFGSDADGGQFLKNYLTRGETISFALLVTRLWREDETQLPRLDPPIRKLLNADAR